MAFLMDEAVAVVAGGPGGRLSPRTVLSLVVDDTVADALEDALAPRWRVRRMADVEALQITVVRERPDALLVDGDPALGDPNQIVRTLRADFRTAGLPLVVVVPETMPAEQLLELGDVVDDYVSRPWAEGEPATRLAWALRRNIELSPMAAFTGLPGLVRARQDLVRRIAAEETFAYCHLDLDGFAAFNEVYGYQRGDQMIVTLAATLRRAAAEMRPEPFLGHIGGDDFLVICQAEQARPACRDVADMFETDSVRLYGEDELARGALLVVDRRGNEHEVPLITVSVGVATNEHRRLDSAHHVATIAVEMLRFAKQSQGSSIGVDRRKA